MNKSVLLIAVAAISVSWAGQSLAADLTLGCLSRPACGKVCRLVHDTETLVSICYGCECATICVPGRSKPCRKRCESTCCGTDGCGCGGACGSQAVKCEFCWRDWIACGCATPRTVKVLTKYEAEKTVDYYYWEVVDANGGCCVQNGFTSGDADGLCLYKSAPPEAELGDTFELSSEERAQLAQLLPANSQPTEVSLASAEADVTPAAPSESPEPSIWKRMATALRLAK